MLRISWLFCIFSKHSVNYRNQTFIYNNSDCHYEPYSSSRYEFILHYLKTIFHSFLKN